MPSVPHVLRVADRIYTGGEPDGDEGFATLAKLGIKTVVSVDGAKPQVEEASRHGLRYVHIPIGYEGVSREAGLALAKLVRDAKGPFYIHCHHGQHRGPAAAAVACRAAGVIDAEGATDILRRAGTSHDYAGLWRDVAAYQAPPADAKLPELVESAKIGSLTAAMAGIDRRYDNLKLCQENAWSVPPAHPDMAPAHEALLLKEAFREAARRLPASAPSDQRQAFANVEAAAQGLEDAIKAGQAAEATRRLGDLKASCKKCHAKFRN